MASLPDESVDAGKAAAFLGIIEIGLGSVLHSLHIPFAGHSLSLNQAFFLTRFSLRSGRGGTTRFLPATISSIAAILKALSPAGKKLTPMLAIASQGLLFNVGTVVGGRNVFGFGLGACLLSLWAFVQPLLIYYALFGEVLVDFATHAVKDLQKILSFDTEHLVAIAVAVVAAKTTLAFVVVLVARFAPERWLARYEYFLLRTGLARRGRLATASVEQPASLRDHAVQAGKDLLHPMFLISLGVMILFLLFVESRYIAVIWVILRFLAVGFLLFFFIRALPLEVWLARAETRSPNGMAAAIGRALATVKRGDGGHS